MERSSQLDAARAIAVLAMVFGHTLDAVLSAQARLSPGVLLYWEVRTVTAPLFLAVSGWVVLATVSRLGLTGAQVLGRYLPRAGLLLGLGWLLRFPAYDVAGLLRGDQALLIQQFSFDALHCIAASLGVSLLVLAAFSSKGARLLAFGALVLALPLAAGPVWRLLESAPLGLRLTLGGPLAPFPLVPWSAYFFAGALLGLGLEPLKRTSWKVIALLLLGSIAVVLAGPTPAQQMPLWSWNRWLWRLGPALLVLAAAFSIPQRLAKWLAPVGRISLWVYVIHLPMAYGWGIWPGLAARVGPVLAPRQAILTALAVCGLSILLGYAGKRRLYPWLRQALSQRSTQEATVAKEP